MSGVERASQRRPAGYAAPGTLPTIGGAARTPNASRPTQVVATVQIALTNGQDRTVNIQVSPDQTTAFATIASVERATNVTGLGVSVADTTRTPVTFEVPAGGRYQFTQSGTGTATLPTIVEQTI